MFVSLLRFCCNQISEEIAEAACCVYCCAEMDKELLKRAHMNNYIERENINIDAFVGRQYKRRSNK
jgi:hypothetical protein